MSNTRVTIFDKQCNEQLVKINSPALLLCGWRCALSFPRGASVVPVTVVLRSPWRPWHAAAFSAAPRSLASPRAHLCSGGGGGAPASGGRKSAWGGSCSEIQARSNWGIIVFMDQCLPMSGTLEDTPWSPDQPILWRRVSNSSYQTEFVNFFAIVWVSYLKVQG